MVRKQVKKNDFISKGIKPLIVKNLKIIKGVFGKVPKVAIGAVGGFILILAIVLVLFVFKGEEQATGVINYSTDVAEKITHATSGYISQNEYIRVRFSEPIITRNHVGAQISKGVFKFNPDISGVVKWDDVRTIVFIPNEPLEGGETYKGELDFSSLFPHLSKEKIKPLQLQFRVAKREIDSIKGNFELVDREDPRYLKYEGNVKFTESVDIRHIEKAVSLYMDDEELELEWKEESGNTYHFVSSKFERAKKRKVFKLIVSKEELEIPSEHKMIFHLEPMRVFRVSETALLDSDGKPKFKIKFNDEIDTLQDIEGLVRIEPSVDIKLKVENRNIIVSGNFRHGETYRLVISKGIRSRWGIKTESDVRKTIKLEDIKPSIVFASGGVYVPSTNRQKILFKSVNVKNVYVEIKKVFENNLCQFLQTEKIDSGTERSDRFNDSYVNRVGVVVFQKKLEIGEKKNTWLQHELDLRGLLKEHKKGLFLVRLSFNRKDMIWDFDDSSSGRYYYGEEWYSNPNSAGYIYRHGYVFKPVLFSDVGLTYKRSRGKHVVLATNIVDSKPISGVNVALKTYQNQLIASGSTGSDGITMIESDRKDVFYIEAEKDDQKSVIKLNEMGWNLSNFDVSGEESDESGIRAFIYTERGVYRPGDEINFSLIARNEAGTFPENHPITLEIINPINQSIKKIVKKKGIDGFYSFKFESKPEDPTGNWMARFTVGSRVFTHTFKVETVVPYRLKIKVDSDKKRLTYDDRKLKLNIHTTYLMGNPASSHKAEARLYLKHSPKKFSDYPGFIFNNESIEFKSIVSNIFSDNLDSEGKAVIEKTMPYFGQAPSALDAQINVKVYEKGGRPVSKTISIPVDPFDYYVGLEKPKSEYGWLEAGSQIKIRAVCINQDGKPIAGRNLRYKIYHNRRYWWWEYDSRKRFHLNYKSDLYTDLVDEGTVVSSTIPVMIEHKPEVSGEYLVEVQEDGKKGHMAGFFVNVYYWGETAVSPKNAGTLMLKSDKKTYFPGDEAIISFPAPAEGTVFVSVERGNRILSTNILEATESEKEMRIRIPVTKEMLPNSHVSVSVIQPHSQTLNDRPIRIYGVIPLKVEEPRTRHELIIKAPEVIKSNQSFEIELQTSDKKRTQFTVAVVDVGLLDLTNFRTPNPFAYFFKKLALNVETFDLFDFIVEGNKGDIFKRFAVGGDFAEERDYRREQLAAGKAKRFKPVSLFKGPMFTDSNGKARLSFKMSDYIGAVKLMAVSARGNSYAHEEKSIPVKTDLMILPTFPRVLAPVDRITVPVTVFAMDKDIKDVKLSIMTEGPVHVEGNRSQEITFSEPGEKDVFFELKALEAVGDSKIIITAKSEEQSVKKVTEITVRSASPRIYDSVTKKMRPGDTVKIQIPNRGLKGSNNAKINILRRPNLNFGHRFKWLIHYPYGCIEQTTSTVFPQLYLKHFIKANKSDEKNIDRNINAAILRLQRFQTASGGFSYWPGGAEACIWGTNYAGHFMIEAKKLGYRVPENLITNWYRFQRSRSRTTRDRLIERVYRVYLLALYGKPEMGAMNLLKENNLKDMTNTEKWLLAGAYKLAGVPKTASSIIDRAGIDVRDYNELGGTYGSTMRDKAMILELLVIFEKWSKAEILYEDIAESLSSHDWYSTQTLGYSMLAIGKYFGPVLEKEKKKKPVMSGSISLPDGKVIRFNTTELKFSYEITKDFGQYLTVTIDKKTNIAGVYAVLDWDGLPLVPDVEDVQKNLWMNVVWLSEDGLPIDPISLKQGETFWAHFTVKSLVSRNLEELALVQVLPSGWEIENIRLSGEDLPDWTSRWNMNKEEYLDIRDDRIMWFFDIPRSGKVYDFVVKLNAVTAGEFTLPPTIFEAMYDNRYKAVKVGKKVKVIKK